MTQEKVKKIEEIEEKELKTYEIGFLLSPLVPEEGVTDAVNEELVTLIEKRGGKVQSRTTPEMKTLAYTITHSFGNERSKYKNAYFGALVFEINTDEIKELTEDIKNSSKIIRFITLIFKKEEKVTPRAEVAEKKEAKEVKTAPAAPVSEAEIDKKLEDLLEVPTV